VRRQSLALRRSNRSLIRAFYLFREATMIRGSDDGVWIARVSPGAGRVPGAAMPSRETTVAVKDLFDVEGSVTTAGCRALAERMPPAAADAACVAEIRASGGRVIGKTNLHELAFGTSGVNPWYGTPANPIDPGRVPGGSSSGSAVAVAIGEADVGLGSDTGGSVRIPAACCGVVGLKTTHGRVPLDGVWPLAPSFDTVGPLAVTVAGVAEGMRLIEGRPLEAAAAPLAVGRAALGPEVEVDPVIDAAVDEALARAELEVEQLPIDGWKGAWYHQQVLLGLEALESDGWLVAESNGEGIGADTLERLRRSSVSEATAKQAREYASRWVPSFVAALGRVGVLALPTLAVRPPVIGEWRLGFNLLTAPVNLAGLPAISLPVPAEGRPPAGLQLVGPAGSEHLLVALAARIERAVGLPAG
jgi:amidase